MQLAEATVQPVNVVMASSRLQSPLQSPLTQQEIPGTYQHPPGQVLLLGSLNSRTLEGPGRASPNFLPLL